MLQNYVVEQGDSIGNYGLALAVSPQGEMLLANAKPFEVDRISTWGRR